MISYSLCYILGACIYFGRRLFSDHCSPNPCKNGGTCKNITAVPNRDEKFICHCTDPFSGRFCDTKGGYLNINIFRVIKQKTILTNKYILIVIKIILFIGDVYDKFPLSKPGKLCKYPVNSLNGCKDAATSLPEVNYVSLSGDGYDLPNGCIFDNITLKQNSLYWNPKGVVISKDPNIRQVCKHKENIYKGIYICQFIFIFRFSE